MINKKSRWVTGMIGLALASSSFFSFAEEKSSDLIPQFEIVRYDVQGNTILSEQEINQILTPYAGTSQNFSSVQNAVTALEQAYYKKGYRIVRVVIPEQELSQGVVKLNVIETKIGKISVTGNQFYDEANIRRSLPSLKEGETPNLDDVSASLRVANQGPTKKTTVQLQTGGKDQPTVDATLQVKDQKPWTAAMSVDNTGDTQSGLNRISAMFQHANIADLDHIFSAQYITSISHPSRAKVFGAGYHIPFYSLGDSLDFYASYSNVDSGIVTAGAFDFGVSGSGTVYGTRYTHNFPKMENYESNVYAEFDHKAFRNNISLFNIPLGNDVTVHPISLAYVGNWSIPGTAVNFLVSAAHNISGGSYGGREDFNAARFDSNPNYNLFQYGANFAQSFLGDWQVRFAVNGQITSDSLVPGEQYGIGGANSVRGFFEREIINDEGFTTNLELYTPNLCPGNTQCRILGFYDRGHVSRNHPLFGEDTQTTIASVGLGFRASLAPRWSAQADFAHVIDGATITQKGDNRIHFKVLVAF